MSTSQIPRWAIVGLALLVLFGIGAAAHSAGWSQGYTLGLLAGGASGDSLTPYLVYRGGHGFHPFGFFGGIFRFAFFFLLLALILKFLGCARWRMQGEHHSPWHHHPRGPQENGPQGGYPPSEQPGQGTPPAESSSADGPTTPAGSQPTVWTHV
jgi:hypothetical protein